MYYWQTPNTIEHSIKQMSWVIFLAPVESTQNVLPTGSAGVVVNVEHAHHETFAGRLVLELQIALPPDFVIEALGTVK